LTTATNAHSTVILDAAPDWPTAVAIPPQRILSGSPAASLIVLSASSGSELGLWRVTEGEFTTAHDGYVEFITILSGDGELVHDDGTVTVLGPGVVMWMADGWTGRWIVREPIVKSYTTITSR
jgi:uncharacterized cupin superfamily protein